MFVSYRHESVRLTGRWDVSSDRCAETTNTGSYVEFAFEGKMAAAYFDIEGNLEPMLHLWMQIDGGDRFECPLSGQLRVICREEGRHVCRIIYKGGAEAYSRWYRPLHGKVSFCGVITEKPVPIGEDDRMTIEFVGDSITEGVLIDVNTFHGLPCRHYDVEHLNRVYQDDVCATYAWLTAEKLNLRPVFMGYGAVGVTRAGQGRVPDAVTAYPYNFDGSPVTRKSCDVIMINHGANDRGKPVELYLERYAALLDEIRAMNPSSKIVSLSAFCGAHHEALGKMIAEYNEKNGCDVAFIDSTDWIPVEPLHPLRDGHQIIADHLAPILGKIIKK